jgi:hypothetical protein
MSTVPRTVRPFPPVSVKAVLPGAVAAVILLWAYGPTLSAMADRWTPATPTATWCLSFRCTCSGCDATGSIPSHPGNRVGGGCLFCWADSL